MDSEVIDRKAGNLCFYLFCVVRFVEEAEDSCQEEVSWWQGYDKCHGISLGTQTAWSIASVCPGKPSPVFTSSRGEGVLSICMILRSKWAEIKLFILCHSRYLMHTVRQISERGQYTVLYRDAIKCDLWFLLLSLQLTWHLSLNRDVQGPVQKLLDKILSGTTPQAIGRPQPL